MTEEDKKAKEIEIVVNGTEHEVEKETVSYEQVTTLAYPVPPTPGTVYDVTYERAKDKPHHGSLVAGQSVDVKKKGTEFDVTPTGKS